MVSDVKQERAAIGARLRQARLDAGVTQDEAMAAVNVARTTISNWESGRNLPDLLQFRTLVGLYGATSHYTLVGRHPLQLSEGEATELTIAARSFSPGLRRRVELLLMIVGAKPSP